MLAPYQAVKRPSAYGLHFALIGWARQNLTDGFVPDHAIKALAPQVKASPKRDIAELVRTGLLVEATGGVQIADYSTWQETRAEVEARRAKARLMATARWVAQGNAQSIAPSKTQSNAVSNAQGNATYSKEEKSKEQDLRELNSEVLSSDQRADLNFLAQTLDAGHRWPADELRAKLAELGPEGLLRALANEHLRQHGTGCVHYGDSSDGRVVVKGARR